MALDPAALIAHLNMTADDADQLDEQAATRLLQAAQAHTERQLGFPFSDTVFFPGGAPPDVEQAVLMLAAHWYENREASIAGVAITAIPFGYDEIIREHRTYSYG